jgi:small-conductance mechanosensitive channel
MDQAPIKEEKITTYNKKALLLISVLIIGGTVLGLILSTIFVTEANTRIQEFADELTYLFGDNIPPFINIRITPLSTSEIILPTLGIVVVCISMFLLIGLIAVYFKVFVKTKSKYILGLFFVLVPLFIESISLVYTLRSLFSSLAIPAIPPGHGISESIGFEMGGLGQILVIVSLFENIGLCILLYLSNE